jgi:hypothetical protein
MCERNLGFEAEHHERALRGIPHARHRVDHAAKRYGVLTTEEVKHGMCTITNTMLREHRINILKPLLSEDPEANARRLHEQLTIYSLQFKEAINVFSKTRAALSGSNPRRAHTARAATEDEKVVIKGQGHSPSSANILSKGDTATLLALTEPS